MEVNAVHAHCLGIRSGLTAVLNDLGTLQIGQWTAGNFGDVEIGIDGCGDRQLILGQQTLGIAHAAQAGSKLDEDPAAAGMNALGQVTPAHKIGTGAINSGEVGEVALFRNGGINMVADGNQTGGQQTDAALCAGKEILQHFIVGTAGFLRHLAIAHRGHHHTVLYRQAVDLNGGEHLVVGIKILGHAACAAGFVFVALGLKPVAVGINELFHQSIGFQ